jgi:hypothetical protein
MHMQAKRDGWCICFEVGLGPWPFSIKSPSPFVTSHVLRNNHKIITSTRVGFCLPFLVHLIDNACSGVLKHVCVVWCYSTLLGAVTELTAWTLGYLAV